MKRNYTCSFDEQKIEYVTFNKSENPLAILLIIAENSGDIKNYTRLLGKLSERGILSAFYMARKSFGENQNEKCDDFTDSIKDACQIAKELTKIYNKKTVVLGAASGAFYASAFAARYKSYSSGAIFISPTKRPQFFCRALYVIKQSLSLKKSDKSTLDFMKLARKTFGIKEILKLDVNLPVLILGSQEKKEQEAAKYMSKILNNAGIKRVNSIIYPKNVVLCDKLSMTASDIYEFVSEVSGNV